MTNPIQKYLYHEFNDLFSDATKYAMWAKTSVDFIYAHPDVPKGAAEKIRDFGYALAAGGTLPVLVRQREAECKHEFNAFLRTLSWFKIGDEDANSWYKKYLHHNLTSSDVQDTVLVKQLAVCADQFWQLVTHLSNAMQDFKMRAPQLTPGFTHGQPAVWTTWQDRVDAWRGHFGQWHGTLNLVKASGPVGLDRARSDANVVDAMQIIPRHYLYPLYDRIEMNAIAMDKVCTDIRILASHGLVVEGAAAARDGSSAMPKKLNPVLAEQVCGLSRLVRSRVRDLRECGNTWLERDLCQSSIERVNIPEVMHLYATALTKMILLFSELNVIGHTDDLAARADEQQVAYNKVNAAQLKGEDRFTAYEGAKNG